MNIWDDIHAEFEFFFDDLNWTFIFMFLCVLYGIKHKEEFYWYNLIFDKSRLLKAFKSWVAGLIVGIAFCFFTPEFTKEYVSQLLRSWVIVIVFNSIFTNKKIDIDKDGNIDI